MAYTFSGSNTANFSGSTATVSLSIGATANPFVIVGCQSNGGLASPSLTVGGVTLTKAVEDASQFDCIFYGQITGGLSGSQNVVLTQTGGAGVGSFALWYTSDNVALSQSTSIDGTGVTAHISVNSGDYLFAYARAGSVFNFSGSTQTPTGDRAITGAVANDDCADWVIASTNASFAIASNTAVAWNVVAASFSVAQAAPPTAGVIGMASCEW